MAQHARRLLGPALCLLAALAWSPEFAAACDLPIANCFVSPCTVNKGKCPAGTTCEDNYCGGCYYR
jgi:hypothetical protein